MNSIDEQSMDIDTFSKLLDGISEISHNGRNLEGIFNDQLSNDSLLHRNDSRKNKLFKKSSPKKPTE